MASFHLPDISGSLSDGFEEMRVLGQVPQSRGWWGFCQRDAVRVASEGTWEGEGRKKGVSQPPSRLMDLAVVQPILVDLSKELPISRSEHWLVLPYNQITLSLVEGRAQETHVDQASTLISDGEGTLWSKGAEWSSNHTLGQRMRGTLA